MPSIEFWTLVSLASYACALVAIIDILLKRRDPRGMIAWIFALIFLPIVGVALYALIGYPPLYRKVRRREKRKRIIAAALAARSQATVAAHPADTALATDAAQRSLMAMASAISETSPTGGNAVEIHHDAERMFTALFAMIESARSHVHIEYYIYADDETGQTLGDLLARKVRDGVEVRLLLDAVGCWKLSRAFVRDLHSRGVRVAFFLPWGLTTRRLNINCRNHRKLVVVDGTRAVIGSHNIADEYRGRKAKFGPWRDTTLCIHGPAAAQLQEIFAEDWHFATRESLLTERYFPPLEPAGRQVMQIIPSGPDRRPRILDHLLFAAVSDARHGVLLITPYFVPDNAMLLALESAALRGVRVRLLLPSKSDHWMVLWAGRATYQELLEAGVEIYEYDRGMLHSKVVVVDQRWAMVGSANMDVRSFRINFELTSILYDADAARLLEADFDALLASSHRVLPGEIAAYSFGQQLALGAARMATPIL